MMMTGMTKKNSVCPWSFLPIFFALELVSTVFLFYVVTFFFLFNNRKAFGRDLTWHQLTIRSSMEQAWLETASLECPQTFLAIFLHRGLQFGIGNYSTFTSFVTGTVASFLFNNACVCNSQIERKYFEFELRNICNYVHLWCFRIKIKNVIKTYVCFFSF